MRQSPFAPMSALALAGTLMICSQAAAVPIYALGAGANANTLVRFDSATPATTTPITVTGLTAGDVLVGIAFRPADALLYGVAVNGNTARTYRIATATGVASLVGAATVAGILGVGSYGMTFDPAADRIRMVNALPSDGGGVNNVNNFRLNPNNGSLTAVDPDLDFTGLPGGGNNAGAVAIAALPDGTLYGIVSALDRLVIHGGAAPGFPTLEDVGLLGVDTSNNAGLDIDSQGTQAFAVLDPGGVTRLYTINLATGAATLVGTVGNGTVAIGAIAIQAGDAKADILWRHTSGTVALWTMDGPSVIKSDVLGQVGTDFTILGVGDFNGDGRADILWRHTSGAVYLWFMGGPTVLSTATVTPSSTNGWTVDGVGDFNGDGRADILWRHSSGTLALWLMNGATVTATHVLGTVGLDWTVAGLSF
jgi:hypothetical protein